MTIITIIMINIKIIIELSNKTIWILKIFQNKKKKKIITSSEVSTFQLTP